MTHGSLFSGIGGFELAAEWSGFTNVFLCEIEPFNQRVLKHYWPNSELHTDVKEFPSSDYTGRIDILTGGFPCQPYSTAGKRLGKEDDRHLWPFMLEIIREIAPTYVVGENVRGLVNWSDGLVFEEVCADLEAEGYDVQPFILPAAGVGAPHRRDRVWFVAHAENIRSRKTKGIGRKRREQEPDNRAEIRDSPDPNGEGGDVTNAQRDGLEHGTERRGVGQSEGKTRERVAGHATAESENGNATNVKGAGEQRECITRQGQTQFDGRNSSAVPPSFDQFPTFTPICGGDDGISRELDGITFSKWRNNSIKAYGNAIVPQVAYQIFQAINEYERAKTGRVEA